MGNLLFSPAGRIGSQDFMKGGVVLIIAGVLLSLLKTISPSLILMVGFGNLLLIYPWICIWIKRMQNGNKSGAMIFAYFALYLALLLAFTMIAIVMFADSELWDAAMAYGRQEISMDEYMSVVGSASQENLELPSLIAGVLASFATLVIADKATPNDPSDNKYGPA